MKNFLFAVLMTFSMPFSALAQTQPALPTPGIMPDSPFYFLDRVSEALQEFFTFNPEIQAKLQLNFAAERIAEIKSLLDAKGVGARGLDVAESRLKNSISKASGIVEAEKSKGKDVDDLAKDLSTELDSHKEILKIAFKEQKKSLETQIKDLKVKIREARAKGDTATVESLAKELADAKAKKEALKRNVHDRDEAFKNEGDKIEHGLNAEEAAKKKIADAEEEKQEIVADAADAHITLPADIFQKFDRMIAQAHQLFDKENYVGAAQLAEQAEKSLEKLADAAENLGEAKKEVEDLEDDQEDHLFEAEKAASEQVREATKKELERLKEEHSKAQENAREAAKKLREANDLED